MGKVAKTTYGERIVFSTNVLESVRFEIQTYWYKLYILYKNELRMVGRCKWIFRHDAKSTNYKRKIDKLDLSKKKPFFLLRHCYENEKKCYWEKTFANYISDNGLISRVYKALKKK